MSTETASATAPVQPMVRRRTIDEMTDDALMIADQQINWLIENSQGFADCTARQIATLRSMCVFQNYLSWSNDEIALRCIDGMIVYWIRDDYWANHKLHVSETFYFIFDNGNFDRHSVPDGHRCPRLERLIDRILDTGRVNESRIPKRTV